MRKPVAQLGKLDRLKHLGEKAPGIERKHVDLCARFGDGVQNRLILEPETGGEGNPAFDPPPDLTDAVGQILVPGKTQVERVRLFLARRCGAEAPDRGNRADNYA